MGPDGGNMCGNLIPTVELTPNAAQASHMLSTLRTPERNIKTHSLSASTLYAADSHKSAIGYHDATLMYCSHLTNSSEDAFSQKQNHKQLPFQHRRQHQDRHEHHCSDAADKKNVPSPKNPGYTAKLYPRHFVIHNYHDRCNDQRPNQSSNAENSLADSTTTRGSVLTPFPAILHDMLGRVDGAGLSHIVSWNPHGRAFTVHEPEAFITNVMPMFFRQSKISSFQRQLNLYGFARLTKSGPDKGAYYHEYFLRSRPDLCIMLHRTRVKGTGVRTSSNPDSEPNFNAMSTLPLVPTIGGAEHAERVTLTSMVVATSGTAALSGVPTTATLASPPVLDLSFPIISSSLCRPPMLYSMSDCSSPNKIFGSRHDNNANKTSCDLPNTLTDTQLTLDHEDSWHKTSFCLCDDKHMSQCLDLSSFGDSDDDDDHDDLADSEFGKLLEEVLEYDDERNA